MMTKKKKILVFSIFTLTFAAAAAAASATAILDIFSQSSFWKKTKTKKIQLKEEEEKPNPGGGSTSTSTIPPGPSPDRISELPKEILVHILGFLEMDEFLIGTSLASTQWRNLWKSVSILKFPACITTSGGGIRNNVEKYNNFVDHVLRLRDSQASKIRIFGYYYWENSNSSRGGGGNDGYLERLHNFVVSAAVNQGAQEIQVKISYCSPISDIMIIHFNPSIFTSGELRKFTFDVYNNHFQIQLPRSMCSSSCATQLTYLSLCGIRLPEGDDADAQLHLVCPLLETFEMSNCYSEHLKVLDISAPRLNILSICNLCMRNAYFDGLGGCRIEIRTPNLISLNYEGDVYVDCFSENLPRLADARLRFCKERGMVEKTTSFATKLLKVLTSAKSLTLWGFEVFLQDTLRDLLTPFTSLRNLKLVTNCHISSIHGMVHFLDSCKNIERLFWGVDEKCTLEGDDEHLMLPQCRLSHLVHVHIEGLHGHTNEIEFVKFLLKSSVVLEDIIIDTAIDSPKISIEENLKQFIEEEPSIRRSIKLHIL